MLDALRKRSSYSIQMLSGKAAYWICEALEDHTMRSTTGTLQAAGETLAAFEILNVERALDEADLPLSIRRALPRFTRQEWDEVLAIAQFNRDFARAELESPQWAHLRKSLAQP
jgi:hypothetical protein